MVKQIICVSNSVKQSLSNLKLDQSRLIVIPSGIVLEQETENYSLRKKFGIEPETKVIANLAAISPQKDFMTFVRTAHAFVETYDQAVKFIIVGADQGSRVQVEMLINQLGVADKVIFGGYIADAHKYLSDVDVLLSTSVSEGLGNTIQEAMKYRIPIVATKCEGTVDLVADRKSALLAEIGDHKHLAELIEEILKNSNLSSKLTEHAYASIQKFDIKETSRQVHDLYKKVLGVAQNI